MKEMQEQKGNLSLEEVTTCSILSHIINTKEFEQLKKKGQILYDYRVDFPEQLELKNFRNPQYLMRKISEIKRQKNYQPGKINNLEDMFLCFFSDMDYQDIEYKLVDFLNKNYYSENAPATNRMLHSQQVMLITGLIAKSKAIPESEQKYDTYKVIYIDEDGKISSIETTSGQQEVINELFEKRMEELQKEQ